MPTRRSYRNCSRSSSKNSRNSDLNEMGLRTWDVDKRIYFYVKKEPL